MTFVNHAQSFAGRPVVDFLLDEPLPTLDTPVSWRFSHNEFDTSAGYTPSEPFRGAFDEFLAKVGPSVESLVIGPWGYAAFNVAPISQLCAAAPRLPALRALFLGDMTSEECEVSWMRVGDVSPLLAAYPELEVLRVRGGKDLAFAPVKHERLRELAVETGGLSPAFTRAVLDSELPALTDLELWLGTPDYGGTTDVTDLAPLLAGERFPALRRLGLRNAEIADDLAEALSTATVVPRLERLDLSLGTLGERGAAALLAGQPLTHLTELDLHHHYLDVETAAALVAALPGVRVDVSDPREDEEDDGESYRYTAVGE
ncbi:STM4015 family protein [Micromonospora sp. NPDC050187]|uniref:STM4015 family protein n=1 Tax=Micromonospora sp. NPDC050187 TaxID=3364277 RepID=UPI00379C59B7